MSILESEAVWRDVWKIYDLDKDGFITKEDFTSAIRVLGRRYTTEQMEEKLKKIPNRVDYDLFIEALHEPYDGPTREDLQMALKAFDGRDSGMLGKMDIQSMLTSMGDKLTEQELKIVMAGLPLNGQGLIALDALCDHFTPPVPSTKPNIPQLIKELMIEELHKRELEDELGVDSALPQPAPMATKAVTEEAEVDSPTIPPPPPDEDDDEL